MAGWAGRTSRVRPSEECLVREAAMSDLGKWLTRGFLHNLLQKRGEGSAGTGVKCIKCTQ